jgi:hypothetical protein
VRGSVHVGVLVLVKIADAIDHGLRLLRGCAVVEPDQTVPVDNLIEDGKIAPDGFHIEGVRREAKVRNQIPLAGCWRHHRDCARRVERPG